MGAPWVQKHPQTGLQEYLVLELEWVEDFEQSWSDFTEYFNKSTEVGTGAKQVADGDKSASQAAGSKKDAQPAAGAAPSAAGKAKKLKTTEDATVAAGAAPSAAGKGKKLKNKEDASPDDKSDATLADKIKRASQLKQAFHNACSHYAQLMTSIDTDATWDWARNNVKTKHLVNLKTGLQHEMNDWHKEFLLAADVREVRKKYTPARISVELDLFLKASPLIVQLSNALTGMKNEHVALNTT
jgi:hypothetical protein